MNPKARELVERLRSEVKDVHTTNVSLFHTRRQITIFGELLVVLGEESEKQSDRLKHQVSELVAVATEQKRLAEKLDVQTVRLISLTVWLRGLTVALVFLTVAIIALEVFHRIEARQNSAQAKQHTEQKQQEAPKRTSPE